MLAAIREPLLESIKVKREVVARHTGLVAQICRLLIAALRDHHTLFLFGNGGSAADAQHVAAEFVGRFQRDRQALPAIALTTDTSIITSIGNDVSFDQIFARQIRALARAGDVAVGISTSGTSRNVIEGLLAAKERGAITIGFTGRSGGNLEMSVDFCFKAPSSVTARIQEAHIAVWHAICDVVERDLVESQ